MGLLFKLDHLCMQLLDDDIKKTSREDCEISAMWLSKSAKSGAEAQISSIEYFGTVFPLTLSRRRRLSQPPLLPSPAKDVPGAHVALGQAGQQEVCIPGCFSLLQSQRYTRLLRAQPRLSKLLCQRSLLVVGLGVQFVGQSSSLTGCKTRPV